MRSFLQKLFKLGPGGDGKPGQAYLAAFGKHPGWDDHVEIGLESEPLAMVKRVLYVEGIGGNIESGTWDKLSADQRLARFDHLFLWAAPDGSVLAGQLWSSRDGKGRARYPMILCADCGAAPIPWVVRAVFPVLADVAAKCAATDSAAGVSAAVASGLLDLRSRAAARAQLAAAPQPPPDDAIGFLLGRPEIGADRHGLLAILYQIEGELAPTHPLGRAQSQSRVFPSRGIHLRVPACAGPSAESVSLWARFLAAQLGDGVPALVLQPLAGTWTDLIVGQPGVSQLYCILASLAAVPLTTEIPYNFEPAFVDRANRFLASPRAHAPRG